MSSTGVAVRGSGKSSGMADGNGPAAARPLVTLKGLTAKQIAARDFGL